ncbi:hypothetical protein J1N35_022512 [Gossypium stocksii]|uniref:Uncharacterized protein n=1 Tax=Gossypium stocksii TaxID=47602 RepID=A0A9D3VGX3_9ROSI|nr:hypothetical protein J1N35_022512 [Gossypium stocksii]
MRVTVVNPNATLFVVYLIGLRHYVYVDCCVFRIAMYKMQNTRGKSKVPTHSKKRKTIGTLSSSSLAVTTRHQYFTFDHPPHR